MQALCAAASMGHVKMVQLLLDKGADATAKDKVDEHYYSHMYLLYILNKFSVNMLYVILRAVWL